MILPDTIVATATPHGFGGISVVRMSGPISKDVILSVSIPAKNKKKVYLKHKTVSFVKLIDENRIPFEDSLVTFFQKPSSYTGEDIVEISCHGNPSIVNKIISVCCIKGARVAEPGEFTRRAFLNGKIDLIQAEAVASIIRSKTDESVSLNFKMLHGNLSRLAKNIKKSLITLLSKIEFELDVSEDSLQPTLLDDSQEILADCIDTIKRVLKNNNYFRMLNEGANVVICGLPNVGKSTLLNCLSGLNRAITGPHPGTTRDVVESTILIGGVPVTLSDTAGIRSSDNEIEKEGVSRAEEKMSAADCVVVLSSAKEEQSVGGFNLSDVRFIHVINKADLCNKREVDKLKKRFPDACIISAKTSFGTKALLEKIREHVGISPSLSTSVSVVTSRQNLIFKKILKHTQSALNLISSSPTVPLELVAFELRDALGQLDSILGKTVTDDILDGVFSSFCVGK